MAAGTLKRAEAFAATGTAPIRRRKLPAEYVVWLVVGMATGRPFGLVAELRA